MTIITTLHRILTENQVVAVVGVSPKIHRPSHGVARYLLEHGYRVIPVNPGHKEILGERCYPGLRDVPEAVDIVDIFRRSEKVPSVVDDAIAINARVIWMQMGIVNEAAAARGRAAGLEVVMDRCMKVDHSRFVAAG